MEDKEINYDAEEVKPRKWLLVILILIAVVIVIYLAYSFINSRPKKEDNHNLFDIIDKTFDSANSFNSKYETLYNGTKYGSSIRNLIDEVVTNNKKSTEHIIELKFNENSTIDPDEMKKFKSGIETFDEYEVTLNYDTNGYINLITIEKIIKKNPQEIKTFNNKFEFHNGIEYGTSVQNLLSEITSNNTKNPGRIITVEYNKTEYTEVEDIKKIRNSLDMWTRYDVSFEYDEEGYIIKTIIEKL